MNQYIVCVTCQQHLTQYWNTTCQAETQWIVSRNIEMVQKLFGRTQYADINGSRSEGKKIKVDFFQRSIAGPLLFIIHFNDLIYLEDSTCKISIYADDNNYKIRVVEANKVRMNSYRGVYLTNYKINFHFPCFQVTATPTQVTHLQQSLWLWSLHIVHRSQIDSTYFLSNCY